MIRYTLKCENDHSFESWFQSAEAFDTLIERGLTACPTCGSVKVEKSLMAPTVRRARKAARPVSTPDEVPSTPQPMVNTQDAEVAEAIQKLKDHVTKNSEYVGTSFAKEARAIHEGEKPERAIYGEASVEDAKKLHDDGIPALPLPFIPRQKTN